MAFSDWFTPGPVGTVEVGKRRRESTQAAMVYFVIALVLLGLWGYFVVWARRESGSTLFRAAATTAYLVIAYFVHPAADTSNLGWLDGLMDNPFRLSDNLNRFLVFLMVFLWPGRFVAESIVDMARTQIRRTARPR